MRKANIGFGVAAIDRAAKRAEAVQKAAERTAQRFYNPRGATSAGGGRGGFKGALKDFFQRDEFVGRTGTISRLAMSGNVMGTLLAFQSMEELFRNWTQWASGDLTFGQVIQNQVKFLVPSILREQVPELLKIYGVVSDRERAQEQIVKNFQAAMKPGNIELSPTGKQIEYIGGRGGQYGGQPPSKEDAERWRNSEDFRRRMNESAGRGVRR